jgi:hypothetical protein
VIDVHFDPDTGSPYWIEKANQLGLNPRKEIRSIEDLALLGAMDETALAKRPIEDFVPKSLIHRKSDFIFAETAGTLGEPKFAIHLAEEFQSSFVAPFVAAANRAGFPREMNWLFVGPTGPHIIGTAARSCARALGSPDVFTVDFDPRWAKKLVPDSFASKRYLEHVESQALRILEVQDIAVLFSTPAVLKSLADKITVERRLKIKGIHLGGMHASAEFMAKLATLFPDAVVLSGYGNTLFGMMPQLCYNDTNGFDYYPHGNSLIVQVVEYDENREVQSFGKLVPYGRRGQVIIHRLDEIQFIANMAERDTAIRIEPPEDALCDGFILDGIRDPQPIVNEVTEPVIGLY